MKPNEARAWRLAQDRQRAARGEKLEEYLRDGNDPRKVVPEMIPGEADLTVAQKAVRKLVRRVERTPRGTRRNSVLDELVVAIARLVFVERVLQVDRLERAGLTPVRLVGMSRAVTSEVLQERLQEHLAAQSGGEGSRVEVSR